MDRTVVSTGYGPTRKTRKSAQREVDGWTNTQPYTYPVMHGKPSYTETIVTEVQEVEGGFACAYVTTRVFHESTACETHDVAGQCDEECVALVNGMMGDAHYSESMVYSDYLGGTSSIDVSGCHSPRPMPYEVARLDADRKAVVIETEHPEDCQCGEIHNEEERLEREHWDVAKRAQEMGIEIYVVTRPFGETGPVVQNLRPVEDLQAEINSREA